MIGTLYIIRNTVNDKVYIGKCYYSLDLRLKDHIYKANKCLDEEKDYNPKLHKAMRELGTDKFSIERLGRFKQGLLELKEVEYIAKYDSFLNGYNASRGGDNPPVANISIEKDVIWKYCVDKMSVREISELLKTSAHTIRTILQSRYIFGDNLQAMKPKSYIAKCDKDTGEWLGLYTSIVEAALSVGNKQCDSHIVKVCKGKRKSAYGYKWSYA